VFINDALMQQLLSLGRISHDEIAEKAQQSDL